MSRFACFCHIVGRGNSNLQTVASPLLSPVPPAQHPSPSPTSSPLLHDMSVHAPDSCHLVRAPWYLLAAESLSWSDPFPACTPLPRVSAFFMYREFVFNSAHTCTYGRGLSIMVSSETSFGSKQPKLEPKLVSALSETRRLFRLFRFNIETGSFSISKQPKQTKDKPKQQQTCYNIHLFNSLYHKFCFFSVVSIPVRNIKTN